MFYKKRVTSAVKTASIYLLSSFVTICSIFASDSWSTIIEAEEMTLKQGWQVIKSKEGFFPSRPQNWSGNRLKGDKNNDQAEAEKTITVPKAGRYAIWVRYEGSYGFDNLFSVEVLQQGKNVASAEFGQRDSLRYNPMAGGWRVHGPWKWHNTDYLYEKAIVNLNAGPVTVKLKKGINGRPGAHRIIDLIWLTNELDKEPGYDGLTSPVITQCKRPLYLRLQVPKTVTKPVIANIHYFFMNGGGPGTSWYFTQNGGLKKSKPVISRWNFHSKVNLNKIKCKNDKLLPAGFDSGWVKMDLYTVQPAQLRITTSGWVTLAVSTNAEGENAAAFTIEPGATRDIIASTGNGRWEDGILQGKAARFYGDYFRSLEKTVGALDTPGKKPAKFGISAFLHPLTVDNYDTRRLAQALGVNESWWRCRPDVDGPGGAKFGFKRNHGNKALFNAHLNRKCFEGDYSKLKAGYTKAYEKLKKQGLGELPQNILLIEEAGPKPLKVMRTWPVINQKFRDYLKSKGIKPLTILDRTALQNALKAGLTTDEQLWSLVTLGTGTPQEAAENPLLFYHSKYFCSQLFAENSATATKMLEEIFPKGTVTNSGSFFPQDGHGVRPNWYDEFMAFRKRGYTTYSSESSWGLCGMPYYIGPQSASYEGTLARALAKYHNIPMGTYLMSAATYGYNDAFVENAAYAFVSHGFSWLQVYFLGTSMPETGYTDPELLKAVKRFAWIIGGIEEQLLKAKVVPSKVAMGWSETTSIWDQATAPLPGYCMPGNTIYALERHYLYILLRHLQIPVDLLSDADIEEGRLNDYDVYFSVGDHITGKAAENIQSWVKGGGVLISGAGGGLWDEYNRPLETLKEVYGIVGAKQVAEEAGKEYIPGQTYRGADKKNILKKHALSLRAKLDLIHAKPVDEVTITGSKKRLPAMGYRQGFTPATGKTLATFRNGEAAVVSNNYGKGKALIMGFLPGIGYMYNAFPKLPYGRGGEDLSMHIYPNYKPVMRNGLKQLLQKVWQPSIPVTCNHPYVEANLLKCDDGKYNLALVNYSGQALKEVELRIDLKAVSNTTTIKPVYNKAEIEKTDKQFIVKMPLDKFDWLNIK